MRSVILLTQVVLLATIPWVAACRSAAPGDGQAQPDPASPRVVVLITVDGLVPDQLSLLGGERATPTLDAFEEHGTVWTDAWTAAPMTRPAVATYLTGLAPDRHGVRDDLFTPLEPDVDTLATRLSADGYLTAAFPDSAFLGFDSGLLRGFDVIADPPPLMPHPSRWLPDAYLPDRVAESFTAWLQTVPSGRRYFAWIHFSRPLLKELRMTANMLLIREGLLRKKKQARSKGVATPVEDVDSAIRKILEAIETREDLDSTLFVVAGTQGDPSGGEDDLVGPGFSLHERAVRVPVYVRYPAGVQGKRDANQPVWAPDVPATVAELAGVELTRGAEGSSLLRNPPADRVVFAWSWATLDQLGWPALRAARSGAFKRIEGSEARAFSLDEDLELDPAQEDRLAAALAQRSDPAAKEIPLEQIRPLLEAQGLTLRPVPAQGQSIGDAAWRREVTHHLLAARVGMRLDYRRRGEAMFRETLELDPDNLGARVGLGMMQAVTRRAEGRELLGPAVERFPTRPDPVHWYAHAVWVDSWEDAEALLELIVPFKTNDSDLLYDLACTRSLAGDVAASEGYLRQAIEAGFKDWGHMETDADLRNLRASGRFSEVLQEYRR